MSTNKKMPTIFIGHGSPENAFTQNEFSKSWKEIAASFPKPKAIIVISAHWSNNEGTTAVSANNSPETIHDFYGFPENYYNFSYPVPGNPELAKKVSTLVKTVKINENFDRGFDHGAWSVLAKMYPEADIPTIQISIDEKLERQKMFSIGQELGKLRQEGVLIIGSGNIVHNLQAINWTGSPYKWALDFDNYIKNLIINQDYDSLINFETHPLTKLALPTTEHFLPLLYIIGSSEGEKPTFFCEKIFAASLSMRCLVFGIN